ncbi:MAG: alkaline phosphatase family protein [Deltaproteobacteria bacterium]|nr:alkaline phosphatase family protein [Deltaproteobacteria bacterium]
MNHRRSFWLHLAVSLVLAGCASIVCAASDSSRAMPPVSVVLISMDGTRPSALTEQNLPSLVDLGRRGARAEALIPVDPSNTFPSHVSLATGVRPDVHRLVNNSFIDPERGRFRRDEPHAWIEAEPIWSIAERHGLRTASFYWVGSEGPWQGGPGPSETRKFSSRTSEKRKVDQILEWLAIGDPALRPRLIMSWFHGADHEGHLRGPDSDSLGSALAPQQAAIARLIREMEARQLFASTTLIFVSDHGMARAETRVSLGRLLARAGAQVSVLGSGGFATIVFDAAETSQAEVTRVVEIARQAGLSAWPREGAPADWHVGDPRFGGIVVRAPLGTAIVNRFTKIDGFHGYDARLPAMAGFLVAYGRGVEPGTQLGSLSSLRLAPTVLRLLDLPIPDAMTAAPIEGLLQGLAGPDGEESETGDTSSPGAAREHENAASIRGDPARRAHRPFGE